jgi:hypothetical protein
MANTIRCSRRCTRYFQISTANENRGAGPEDRDQEDIRGLSEERYEKNDEVDGGDEGKDKGDYEEIISPSSYVSHLVGESIVIYEMAQSIERKKPNT